MASQAHGCKIILVPFTGCSLHQKGSGLPLSEIPFPAQVLALRQENERLKASLAAALNSPVNKQLHLPPTLLLR